MVARLVVLFPLALTASLLPLPYAGVTGRALILVSVAPGLLYLAQGLRRTEAWWAGVALLYLLATFFSALFGSDLRGASLDFVRQAYIVFVSLSLMLCLRNPVSRVMLARGMAFMAVAGVGVIFVLYASYAGFSFDGLADLRAFKFYAQDSLGVALNPVSFAVLLAFLLAYPELSRRRWIVALATVLVLAALVLSGSRTTLLSLALVCLVAGFVVLVRRLPLRLRQIVYFSAVPGLVLAGIYLLSVLDGLFDQLEFGELTTGRTYLWVAALEKFAAKPLTGWGADSVSVNVAAYLPVYDPWLLADLTASFEAGAFHNIYLTVLAEKGLVVFVPAIVMAVFLIRQSWRLRVHRALLPRRHDASYATVALLIVVLILVRGLSEHAGWWGDANSAVDYISYAAASLIVATAAQLDRTVHPKLVMEGGEPAKRWT